MTQQTKSYRFDKRHERLINHLIRHFAKDYPTAIRKILPTIELALKQSLLRIRRPFRGTRLYVLEPSDESFLITLATIDRPKVVEFAKLGVSDMDTFLHRPLV